MKMKKVLREVARANGVSVKEVRKEIQKAVDEAWKTPPNDGGVTAAYQQRVPCRGEIPTPEELIRYMAGEIRRTR